MKKIFTFRRLAVSIAVMLSAAVANAQDANNPWHLIVKNQADTEIAAFNVETLTKLDLSNGKVNIENNWNGKVTNYDYPTETTKFSFEPRKDGTGTGNQVIANDKWSVFYANRTLHISNPTGNVAIYSITGAIIGQYPNVSDFSVNLSPGLYIVKSGKYAAKLLVSNYGTGGTATAQITADVSAASPVIPNLRAGSGIRIYWNITAGTNTTTPVEIADVESFYFTAENSIVFTLKNGNTIELTNYKGLEFATTPAPAIDNSKWNIEKTLMFGGATYTWRIPELIGKSITFAAVHKNGGIKFHIEQSIAPNQIDKQFNAAEINPKVWTISGRISAFTDGNWFYGMTYPSFHPYSGTPMITMNTIDGVGADTVASAWSFNNNTNIIPTTIVQNADGSITMSCSDYLGSKHSHTFIDW